MEDRLVGVERHNAITHSLNGIVDIDTGLPWVVEGHL